MYLNVNVLVIYTLLYTLYTILISSSANRQPPSISEQPIGLTCSARPLGRVYHSDSVRIPAPLATRKNAWLGHPFAILT